MPSRLVVVALLFVAAMPMTTAAANLEQARADYLAALKALERGRLSEFANLRARLDDYPLRAWADYAYFESRLADTPVSALRAFLAANPHAVVTAQLRRKWLQQLARDGDFDIFMKEFSAGERDLQLNCERLKYVLARDKTATATLDEIGKLWMTGESQPAHCDKLFDAWRATGQMTEDRVWERIWLATERRNLALVEMLAEELPRRDRVWVRRLLAMHRDPGEALAAIDYPVENRRAREIVRYGVARLAREDALAAMQSWRSLREEFEFFGEDENYVLRAVGVHAALQHRPEALEWLSAVSADPGDDTLRQWRVRAAVREAHWPTVLRFASMLSDAERADDEWRYWRARALQETGDTDAAREIFAQLARKRSYYGFVAADRVGSAYTWNAASAGVTADERSRVAALPGIRMAQELLVLGDMPEARRQWAFATAPLDNRALTVAATLAAEWGWHDRAIRTANKSGELDDLDLRFPVAYRGLIEANARAYDLDAGWIYGVIRQESTFLADARSPAGALGLMQLMPRTGRLVARELKMGKMPESRILDIENNLKLGAGYLRRMLDRNDNNPVLATASYNAGPHRVRSWLPASGKMPADVWVDSIPYGETRDYVKNVLAFTTIYDFRLGGKGDRIRSRMRDVAAVEPAAGTTADW